MLQQEQPDDYVVGTGESHSVRDFAKAAFRHVGMEWREYVDLDESLLRPAEVDILQADASKARKVLGWRPTVTFEGLVQLMVESDLKLEGEPRADRRRPERPVSWRQQRRDGTGDRRAQSDDALTGPFPDKCFRALASRPARLGRGRSSPVYNSEDAAGVSGTNLRPWDASIVMTRRKRVIVGMSGGVDSSVTAGLLVSRATTSSGITLNLWPELEACPRMQREDACCALGAVEDARRVADRLGIRYYVMNFRDVFEEKVIKDFVGEYARGRTPNPCVRCNQFIKFDALLVKRAARRGLRGDRPLRPRRAGPGHERWLLRKAADPTQGPVATCCT